MIEGQFGLYLHIRSSYKGIESYHVFPAAWPVFRMLDVRGDIFFYRLVSTVTVFLPSNFIKAAPTENNYKYLNDYNEFENQITFNENADSYQR